MADGLDGVLAEQVAYYRAAAGEYGGYDPLPGVAELVAALEEFRPAGRVLELACGPGLWTSRVVRHASEVTAVDAAPEMLARAAECVDDRRVRFVRADVFQWRPEQRFDVVFFGFWLSHVPPGRFAEFWSTVEACLSPGGRVFFVDDALRAQEELIEGAASPTIQRRTRDGRAFRAVKVPYRPEELSVRLAELGWRVQVRETQWPFYWGAGYFEG